MRKALPSGSGYVDVGYSDEHCLTIDFDAREIDDFEASYFNHETVLFWVADSYKQSCYLLLDEVKKIKDNSKASICLAKYYLPCMFSFRHSIELYSKVFYYILTQCAWKGTHEIDKLFTDIKEEINKIQENDIHPFYLENCNESFDELYNKLLNTFDALAHGIEKYNRDEQSCDYYRYLFDRQYELKNRTLKINYEIIKEIINNIFDLFLRFENDLRPFRTFWHLLE